jgi:hypothetical protein
MMTKLFWKTFYTLTLGKEGYDCAVKNAKFTMLETKNSSKGSLDSFYNSDGEQIRGWHRQMNYTKKYQSKDPIQRYMKDFS